MEFVGFMRFRREWRTTCVCRRNIKGPTYRLSTHIAPGKAEGICVDEAPSGAMMMLVCGGNPLRAIAFGVFILSAAGVIVGCMRESRREEPTVQASSTQEIPQEALPKPLRTQTPYEPRVENVGPMPPEPILIDLKKLTDAAGKPIDLFEKPWPKRQFTFLVTGIGKAPKEGDPLRRKASAIEAAVVDAIGRACREILRDPKTGRAPVEYKHTLAEGLIVFGQLVSGRPQTVVLLDHRGRIYELCSREGILAHPPHDAKIIKQIFQATDGTLVLQATRPTEKTGVFRADVGFYRQASDTPADQDKRPVIATGL